MGRASGISRRAWLVLAGGGFVAALVGVRFGLPRLLRARPARPLSPEAEGLVARCFEGIDRARLWDSHVHALGIGSGGSGCRIHPDLRDPAHPIKQFQFDLYRAGLGMESEESADADYVDRLRRLHDAMNPQGKLVLLAFDEHVAADGEARPEDSPVVVPDDYVLRLARENPQLVACASVHPYRPDALDRLDRAAASGARAVKWLPNAMGIDPSSPRCDSFYRRLETLGLPLITHAGKEYAVGAEGQALGNPLLLRRALDAGVRVVVAHCGALGSFDDLDAGNGRQVASFDLFLRLLAEDRYRQRLFGDTSALAQINYGPRPLRELLLAPELHERLVYGSDYPLPALRFLISPLKLAMDGLLSAGDRDLCGEVFAHNPLLYSFVVQRSVRVERDGREHRFAPRVFETAWLFGGPPRGGSS